MSSNFLKVQSGNVDNWHSMFLSRVPRATYATRPLVSNKIPLSYPAFIFPHSHLELLFRHPGLTVATRIFLKPSPTMSGDPKA